MIRKKIRNLILLILLLSGIWYFWHSKEIKSFDDVAKLLKSDGNSIWNSIQNVSFSAKEPGRDSIKIGSFDLTDFNDQNLDNPIVAKTLVAILTEFDVTALQGIQSPDHDALPRLMDNLRQVDSSFDYVVGPRSSHTAINHQFAFIYNKRFVQLERNQLYTIQDPDDVVAHDPLVGWFRAKSANEESAFTFSLVNIRVDATNKDAELDFLQRIKLAVKGDGHNEDDVMLIGNFNQNSISMHNMKTLPGCDFVITQDATDLLGQRQLSNISFPVQATSEFTGRAGVVDFLTKHNLSVEDARKISLHLPIWAEFFLDEGTASGYVASISK